ncbi:hypothetical protein DRQ33_04700 [bacterium]|nr:MAG: hypothetical protein DRQ33_04700 [bacterium]
MSKKDNIFTRIRNAILWVVLILLLIWTVGTGLFLLFPKIQQTAIRIVLRHYKIPLFIDYTSAKLAPGHFIFHNPLIIYTTETDTLIASAKLLEIRYSLGKPIVLELLRLDKPNIDYRSSPVAQKKKTKSEFSLPEIIVKKFQILNGNVAINNIFVKNYTIKGSVHLGSATDNGISANLQLDTLACIIPSRANINNVSGKIIFNNNILNGDIALTLDSTEANLSIHKLNIANRTFQSIVLAGDKIYLEEIDSLLGFDFLEGNGSGNIKISMSTDDLIELMLTFRGQMWEIPMDVENVHIIYNDSEKIVTINKGRGTVWSAYVSDVDMKFFTSAEPIKYQMHLSDVKNFDLMAFDIVHTSLDGSVNITGSGFGDNMNMSIRAKLGAGVFDDFEFDGGNFVVNIDEYWTRFPASNETSFVYLGDDTIQIWGNITYDNKINLSVGIHSHNPQTLLAAFDMDADISGYINGIVKITGTTDNMIAHNISLQGKNISGYDFTVHNIDINGELDNIDTWKGEFTITGTDANYKSFPVDSIQMKLSTSKDKLFFRPLVLQSARGRLRITGILDFEDSLTVKLDGLTLDRTANLSLISPVSISLTDGIFSKNIKLFGFGGIITIDTIGINDKIIATTGDMEGINLSDVSSILNIKTSLSGIITRGHFQLRLNPESYSGDGFINLYANPFTIDKFSFSAFNLKADINNDTLIIRECYFRRPDETAHINGRIFLEDSIAEIDLKLSANGKNPGFLDNFSDYFTPVKGDYIITISASGKIDSPHLSGNIDLRNGVINISQLNDPLENITLRAKINETIVELQKFSAEMKTLPPSSRGIFSKIWSSIFGKKYVKGTIDATGDIDFSDYKKPNINIEGKINNFPIHSTENGYYFVTDGTFEFVSPPLYLNGELTVSEGNILKLGSPSPEPTKIPIPLNVAISTENLWVLTSGLQGDMEAKISGELFISTTEQKLSLLGKLNIDRGKYFVYGQNFTVENGRLEFKKIARVDPELDITAKTSIGEENIFLNATGTLSSPKLELYSSNPDFTQEDILRIFAGVSDSTVFSDVLERRTQDLLEQYVAHNIEQMAQKTLGIDEFIIEPTDENGSYFRPSELRVTVGKRISSGLFLRYSQTLSDSAQQAVELEYIVSRHISIGVIQDSDGSYKLKLDFKWKY